MPSIHWFNYTGFWDLSKWAQCSSCPLARVIVLWYDINMNKSAFYLFKELAIELRMQGKSYGEIRKIIGEPIPKSTLSCWYKGIVLSKNQKKRIEKMIERNITKGQRIAWAVTKEKRKKYLESVADRVSHLGVAVKNKDAAKIALAMLYLGEGSKTRTGSVMFGNSDPGTIKLFLHLFRYCYTLDERKFRCTLQCRADQNIKKLEKFWLETTGIPKNQFYGARVDPRTIGKPSIKKDYKGVCRINYFSSDIFNEILKAIEVIKMGL